MIFDTRKDIIPWNSKLIRLLLFLNKFPYLRLLTLGLLKKKIKIPKSSSINSNFYCHVPNIKCGENVGLADTYIIAYARVTIGNNVSFSFRNMIITSTHDIDDFYKIVASPIVIGDNVWITSNVTILSGVTIGANTIIGARSVVTNDIPANVFAAGNPCRVIKSIKFNKNGRF